MKKLSLEICVESLESAMAAACGGADRIELCEELSLGGVTPNSSLASEARKRLKIPIHCMIRPRGGDFCYSTEEFARMKNEIAIAKGCGMDAVVLGVLTSDGRVDTQRTKELVELARPLPVTFHRAFDAASSFSAAMEEVIVAGAARILTSGGAASANAGRSVLAELVRRAGDRITIMPGSGITPANLAGIVRDTRAVEFHAGLSGIQPRSTNNYAGFEAAVRTLAGILDLESSRNS